MSLVRNLLPLVASPFARAWYSIKPGARILMYHRVSIQSQYDQLNVEPENFDTQIKWLSENRDVKPLPEVLTEIREGRAHKNTIAVTFDDGYLDNLENALPILEKYNVPATIYVTSDFASQKLSHYRYRSEKKRLHLNWQEVLKLSEHPLIHIGSHTVTHPMLSELDDEHVIAEITNSKSDIERNISANVTDFCYPSGNYTERERVLVESHGYTSAVTVKPGANNGTSDLFALKRTEVTNRDSVVELKQKLDGAFDIFHWLLDVKREMKFSKQRQ